jgi:hypothetical protein
MRSRLIAGALLAVTVALLVWLGRDLSLPAVALLGVAVGGTLALVRESSLLSRIGGFLAGVLIAWLGYLLRALVLPDTDGGRAVVALSVVLLCTALVLARAPLWAALLGLAAVVGSYEETYTAAPSNFATESVTAITAVLLSAGFGMLAVTFAEVIAGSLGDRRAHPDRVADQAPQSQAPQSQAPQSQAPQSEAQQSQAQHDVSPTNRPGQEVRAQ